jgi:L-aspartate oxidase
MAKDGTDHVWLSFLTIKDVDIKTRFPHIYEHCLEEGYDITKECIPVVPAQHYFMGGVKVDRNSQTSMRHLYAAGETSCNGVHGANRLASNSLLESLVFGKRAAQHLTQNQGQDSEDSVCPPDTWDKLEKTYQIDLKEYRDTNRYQETCKEAVRDAIREEKAHEHRHNETKH